MHEQLSRALRQFMDTQAITQLEAARKLGTSQALISRVLSCNWKKKSAQIESIANYLGVKPTIDPRTSNELIQALADVWNGEPEDAKALAQCIRAIGAARKSQLKTRY